MLREPVTQFVYVDLAGQVRGKGFPTRLAERRLKSGIGWTPTNLMFTALGTIAPSPWGPFGDVMLRPDGPGVEVDFGDGTPAERFHLCDVTTTDGEPWACCPRTLLKEAARASARRNRARAPGRLRARVRLSGRQQPPGRHVCPRRGAASRRLRRDFPRRADGGRSRDGRLSRRVRAGPVRGDAAAGGGVGCLRPRRHPQGDGPRDRLSPRPRRNLLAAPLARGPRQRCPHPLQLWTEAGEPASHDPERAVRRQRRMRRVSRRDTADMPALCALRAHSRLLSPPDAAHLDWRVV